MKFRIQKLNYIYDKENKMLYVDIDFCGKHKKVVCTKYNFLQRRAITQKIKMVDLDILQSLKWQNILHSLSEVLYSRRK